ncbi:hypothetical protein PANO111632_20865 [Paracoccus nototheniae]
MARRRALQAAFETMGLPDPFRKVGLHGRELFAAADEGAGVQLAAFVEGDGHHRHVGRGLIPVDHCGKHVLGPVASLEPVEGIGEVGILLFSAHGVQSFGRATNKVLQPMDGIAADLLGGAVLPGIEDGAAGIAAHKDGILRGAPGIGIGRVTFTEGMLERRAHIAHGFDLGAAKDGEAAIARLAREAPDGHGEVDALFIVTCAHRPNLQGKVYVYSLDNLAQGQIIRSPRNAGKGHINLTLEVGVPLFCHAVCLWQTA